MAQQISNKSDQVLIKAACKAVSHWNLSEDEAIRILGIQGTDWLEAMEGSYTGELTPQMKIKMICLIEIFSLLSNSFDATSTSSWMQNPNANQLFNGRPPIRVITEDGLAGAQNVRNYLEQSLTR